MWKYLPLKLHSLGQQTSKLFVTAGYHYVIHSSSATHLCLPGRTRLEITGKGPHARDIFHKRCTPGYILNAYKQPLKVQLTKS